MDVADIFTLALKAEDASLTPHTHTHARACVPAADACAGAVLPTELRH